MSPAKTLGQRSVFILMLAFSCTEDESQATEKSCVIIESTTERTGSPEPLFNTNVRQTVVLNNENKPVIKRTTDLTGRGNNHEIRYFYDDSGRPVRIEYDYSSVSDVTNTITYLGDTVIDIRSHNDLPLKRGKYNANKQLIEAQLYTITCYPPAGGCIASKPRILTYEYENGDAKNPTLYRTSNGWVEITLDDKKGIWDQFANDAPGPYFNNPTSLVDKDSNGNVVKTTRYEYEYNREGYPSKMTVYEGDIVTVSTFKYTCR